MKRSFVTNPTNNEVFSIAQRCSCDTRCATIVENKKKNKF